MNAIRSFLVFTWIVLSVIPVGLTLVFCSLFLSDEKLWWWFAAPWLRGVIAAARIVGGVRYRVHGEDNLPTADDMRRVILCPKHQSTWETFFFASFTSHPLAYVFKKELLRIPVFGWCMGTARYDPYRPQAAHERLGKSSRAGTGADGSRQVDYYVSGGDAY